MSARIPVHKSARDDAVVAHAIVDDADYEHLSQYRWRLSFWGYAERSMLGEGRTQFMHRELCGLLPGGGKVVHHVNEDKMDNRRSNLEVCADWSEHGDRAHPKKDAYLRDLNRVQAKERRESELTRLRRENRELRAALARKSEDEAAMAALMSAIRRVVREEIRSAA